MACMQTLITIFCAFFLSAFKILVIQCHSFMQYKNSTGIYFEYIYIFKVLFVRSSQDAPAEEPKQRVVSRIPVPEKTQSPDHKSTRDDSADVVKPLHNPSDACLFVSLF